MSTLETVLNLEVDCEGDWVTGERSTFGASGWYPGTHDSVENFKVFLTKGLTRLEITHMLTEHDLEKLKDKFIEQENRS